MKNILLPTDFSKNSWNAINYAIQFFQNQKCNFYITHINNESAAMTSGMPPNLDNKDRDAIQLKHSELKMRELIERIENLPLNRKRHNFYTLLEKSPFIDGIRKIIDQKEIDFIVMGTKGASSLEKIILGSNTADVLTKVKCNTLVIPENATYIRPKEIALPTDFTLSHNLHILDPLSEILEEFNSALRILHISKYKEDLNKDQIQNRELLDEYFHQQQHSFHYSTESKVEIGIQNFVENRSINMICMVAKNINYFQKILFHSKVGSISYHTDIPFLVIHEKKESHE
ncbi:universal stress protein [Bizionia paragorgiae]|uniref:Nucleotide-binding universal stress protein, UspA family n=1 Tax=Bizionia paragorgiae TaxID=283786 RepID=A0A1H3WIH2_BIZPA|nr:universal stress protein [Bizionia paragorgiae]SDZ86957.1 Nucleotide-binding universal stress protein, UspA family [Bizionia paragorgiae]